MLKRLTFFDNDSPTESQSNILFVILQRCILEMYTLRLS